MVLATTPVPQGKAVKVELASWYVLLERQLVLVNVSTLAPTWPIVVAAGKLVALDKLV